MIEIIFATLILLVINLMLPTIIATLRGEVDAAFLFSVRDTAAEESVLAKRARRAQINLQESLFIFVPLAIMGLGNGAAAEAATIWLGLRVAYLASYLLAIPYLRTLIWFGTLYCLYLMGAALV